jgi:hypothetical protein
MLQEKWNNIQHLGLRDNWKNVSYFIINIKPHTQHFWKPISFQVGNDNKFTINKKNFGGKCVKYAYKCAITNTKLYTKFRIHYMITYSVLLNS